MKYCSILFGFIFLFLFTSLHLDAQPLAKEKVIKLIEEFKADSRGPYRDIRWFCKDGSNIGSKEKCPDPGGVQRARYKNEVIALAESNHLFFGQILATTENPDFWDAEERHSRLVQYQLEKYLRGIDDGWILRKAQYYRGAVQIEDEQAWGNEFLLWLLKDKKNLEKNFFLIRQAAKDIPHREDDNQSQNIRSLSKIIADTFPAFNDLRVKIHGQPESADIEAVADFKVKNQAKLRSSTQRQLDRLITEMEQFFAKQSLEQLGKLLRKFPTDHPVKKSLKHLAEKYDQEAFSANQLEELSNLLWDIRMSILNTPSASQRLALLDLSIELEDLLFREVNEWQPANLQELLLKTYQLAQAAAACGFLEIWEWEQTNNRFFYYGANLNLPDLLKLQKQALRWTEWGTTMVRATYDEVVDQYTVFEPLSYGFIDDRIRGSVLLPLGNCAGQLGEFFAEKAQFSNQVMNISGQSQMRGMNPGYAMGELVVVSGSSDEVEVSKEKIYLFYRPSSDLKPVAGIATVTEGNAVSHVQLLARNLGIPNAVLSEQNLMDLKKYAGQQVFYAVSNRGTVIMKPVSQMTTEEKKLFEVQKRKEERVAVPIQKIDLAQKSVLNLRQVDATSSGRLCGPKAANLGQLKALFPNNVVEGLVIPFGIFRAHLQQEMPGKGMSYWRFLRSIFREAREMEEDQYNAKAIETFVLGQLAILREAIKEIPLQEDFVRDLQSNFQQAFGKKLGDIPVFLRSDTNMEDLKDFTGAGLNLTVFNAVDVEKILQGIRDVWASPYTERSYKWRQRFLLNPEQVFPSILVIPTVDVDHSGVMITKGLEGGEDADLTIAFNRGAGGAVDGQASESYLLRANQTNLLQAPAREPYARKLPNTGGSQLVAVTFEQPILSPQQLLEIRQLAAEIKQKLPNSPGIESKGPFDVEFGFKDDRLWLFQVRPFVENKQAKSSNYLDQITPEVNTFIFVDLDEAL